MEKLRKFQKVCEIVEANDRNPARLIPILQSVQEEYRYLPEEILTFIATSLNISPAKVYGVATFYSHFTLKPKGKYIVRVCDGTACHVKGSTVLLDALRAKLKLAADSNTTSDMLFTLETVSCLGACGLAPAVVINEQVYGQMTPDKVSAVIDKIIEEEKNAHAAG
jgi:NADH-quinone oxidoreductase subunit E